MQLCQLNLQQFEEEGISFLQRIITGDESSFHTFDPESKIKDTQWIPKGARRPRKALRSCTRQSTILTAFFDCNGLVHTEWKGRGESITSEEYCALLGQLRESIRRKRPQLWHMNGDWRTFLLHHDNATPHTATITLASLGENHMDMVPHPPYSPDLAPSDYFLFPEIKSHLRGIAYRNIDQVQAAANEVMRKIPVEKFEAALKDLPVRWAKCVSRLVEITLRGMEWRCQISWWRSQNRSPKMTTPLTLMSDWRNCLFHAKTYLLACFLQLCSIIGIRWYLLACCWHGWIGFIKFSARHSTFPYFFRWWIALNWDDPRTFRTQDLWCRVLLFFFCKQQCLWSPKPSSGVSQDTDL